MDSFDALNHLVVVFGLQDGRESYDSEELKNEICVDGLNLESECDVDHLTANEQMNINCNHNFEPGPFTGCGCTGSYNGGAGGGTNTCGCDGGIYQSGLVNKKPMCSDDSNYFEYQPQVLYASNSPCRSCCTETPDTYELIRNTDAQRYKGRGLDRSYYFSG